MKKEVDSIIDGHKIHLHPYKNASWLGIKDCYPIHVEIGVTNRCNQNCVFCALDFARGKIDIDKEVMLKALKDMANPDTKCKLTIEYEGRNHTYYDKVESVMFGGEGEPTLHENIGLFIQKAKEYSLDVALTTNGVYFNKELREQCLPYLSWIKFSIDSGTAETYSKIHKTPKKYFDKLVKNIYSSVEFKKEKNLDVVIGTQFLMVPQNTDENEAVNIIKILKEINPDYLSVKPYSYHPRSKKDLIVDFKLYNDLEKIFDRLKEKSEFNIEFRRATIERIKEGNKYPECYGLPFISLIDSKGDMLPCNLFYNKPEFVYGNLYKSSFSDIWKSDKRKDVLTKIKNNGMESCRKGCRCDAGNRYLQRLKKPQLHDNFT